MADALLIRQNHVPIDPRVRRELNALADSGLTVDVFCTRRPGEPLIERRSDGVRIYRMPLYHRRGGVPGYLLEYLLFFAAAFVVAALLHVRRRYRVVQVNSLPDALVFAASVPKALGASVLLDLHECMPEFAQTKFKITPTHPLVRVLAFLEQRAIRFADHAITCTPEMKEAFVRRGARAEKIDVILNSADEDVFDPRRAPAARHDDGTFRLICHGAVEERYGIDTAVRAVARLADELPDLRLDVYGEGPYLPIVRQLADDLGVDDRVRFTGEYVPIDDLVAALAAADAGVVAMKRDAFRDLTQCNKMYDLVAMETPVICSWTVSAAAAFDEECFAWFTSDDAEDLARAIRSVHADPARRARLVAKASERVQPYRWPYQRKAYLDVMARFLPS